MNKVFVLGSINLDYLVSVKKLPKTGETVLGNNLKKIFGGKGANQAVSCSKTGSNVYMIGSVGNDNVANEMIKNLQNNNINTTYITKKNTNSGSAFITVDNTDNIIVVSPGANFEITLQDVRHCLTSEATENDIFVVQFETPLQIVKDAINYAKSLGLKICVNPSPFQKFDIEILNNIDYLFVNQSELNSLLKLNNKLNDITSLLKYDLKVIYTLGKDGAIYYSKTQTIKQPGFKVDAIDPTAAGDSFLGSFVSSIAKGLDIQETLIYANCSGALATTKLGAQSSIPNQSEIIQFIKKNK